MKEEIERLKAENAAYEIRLNQMCDIHEQQEALIAKLREQLASRKNEQNRAASA